MLYNEALRKKNPTSYTKQETTMNCSVRLFLQAMVNNLISSSQNKYSAAEAQAKMQYCILNLDNFFYQLDCNKINYLWFPFWY